LLRISESLRISTSIHDHIHSTLGLVARVGAERAHRRPTTRELFIYCILLVMEFRGGAEDPASFSFYVRLKAL